MPKNLVNFSQNVRKRFLIDSERELKGFKVLVKVVCLALVISIESIVIAAAPRPTVVAVLGARTCTRCGEMVQAFRMSDGTITRIPSECKDLAERFGNMLVGGKGQGWGFDSKKPKE